LNLGFFYLGKQVAKGRGTCRVYPELEMPYQLRTIEQHERDVMVPFFSFYDLIFF
jgi:hypothetical protein